jgi:hypothetical protein
VGETFVHGKDRIVVLVADLELGPSGEEVVPGQTSQISDRVMTLVEGKAEEDGLAEVLVGRAVVVECARSGKSRRCCSVRRS